MHDPLSPIPGEDPVFLDALDHVTRLAGIDRPCLVVGERGTGKELFATRIHYLSSRWEGPLVKVNCAAFTESLLESELFGHEAGSFTGATRRHAGCFERAEGGTLVLDEIASASQAVQEKLLRIIEYGEYARVGGSQTLAADVRVVAAANVDLPAQARSGNFRPDLLDRLAFDVVTIPPLRARRDDILPLAAGFALDMVQALGGEAFEGFTEAAQVQLLAHDWPGNVRELRNAVERSVYAAGAHAGPVDIINIDPFASPWRSLDVAPTPSSAGLAREDMSTGSITVGDQAAPFAEQIARLETQLLEAALHRHRFNQRAAAADLSLSYHQFRRLVAKHSIGTAKSHSLTTQ
jgi:psp operon transcriptional activator